MAQTEQLSSFLCPVCLDLLQTPVSLSCGHNYCLKCIQDHWDTEEEQRLYTCPECRVSFTPRPVLSENLLLAAVVEQMRTAPPAVLSAGPQDLCAGPQDVSCDVCTGVKLKAVQSCLQCVASFCERHLQPHADAAVFQKHQLVAPSHTFQENICPEHHQVKTMFCRTDQQLLCVVCCLEKHKDHETVTSASERAQREAQLRDLLLQNLQLKDTERTSLQQQTQDISRSAHTALQLSRDSFRDMILLLETRAKEVEQKIQSEEEKQLIRVREIQDRVKQELSELQQRLRDLDTLSLTKDHNSFLQLSSTLATGTQGPVPARGHTQGPVPARGHTQGPVPARGNIQGPVPARGNTQGPVPARGHTETRNPFEEVTKAVSKLKKKVQLTVEEGRSSIGLALSRVQVLLTGPRSRDQFLYYSTDFTLDPNTAHPHLSLSHGNRKVTFIREFQDIPYDDEDRFSSCCQVLTRESVTGRCYWELEWSGKYVSIAMSSKDIQRKGETEESAFGDNDKSWALFCHKTSPSFFCDSVQTQASGPVGSRVGVYLDHSAGVLSFHDVFENMRLIHREITSFSQPLHAGLKFNCFYLSNPGDTVFIPKLK